MVRNVAVITEERGADKVQASEDPRWPGVTFGGHLNYWGILRVRGGDEKDSKKLS